MQSAISLFDKMTSTTPANFDEDKELQEDTDGDADDPPSAYTSHPVSPEPLSEEEVRVRIATEERGKLRVSGPYGLLKPSKQFIDEEERLVGSIPWCEARFATIAKIYGFEFGSNAGRNVAEC